jgi:L-rhamnose-H+ transport protein
MDILIGLLIIAIGSVGQASSYVPIKKVKKWSWESFWLVQGIFAWLVFPLFGALLAVPTDSTLVQILSIDSSAALKAMFFGVLWGVGGLTFGLSMRYLGVALGQSIALGTCSAFGTIIPAVMKGTSLFKGEGVILLVGVCITIAGIAVIGYAGSLRSKNMSDEDKKKAIKDFALTKGLLIALLAGVMSACFNLGLEAGKPLVVKGMNKLFETLPATMMVTCGGFITNAAYCLFQNAKNKTFNDYGKTSLYLNNILFCALAGLLWYSQFFGLGMGQSFFKEGSVILAFSWSILMSLNVLFSNVWGIFLKEWKGAGVKTVVVLVLGLLVLISSIVVVGFAKGLIK